MSETPEISLAPDLVDPQKPRPNEGLMRPRIYQQRIVKDRSRFIAWVKSRQIGGSWGATLKVSLHAIETGQDWICLSRGLRQAKRLLEKVAKHIRAYDTIRTQKYGLPSIIVQIGTERIDLANGSAIMAMPCDDETTVGDAANVLIDEYGLFPNSEAIFEALTPCILNGYIIIVLSTPRGRKNKFAQIMLDKTNGWSKHTTTIYDAEKEGLVIRDEKGRKIGADEFLDELRKKGMSEAAIRQEFLCEFLDKATAFITEEEIERCFDESLATRVDWKRIKLGCSRLFKYEFYLGVDVGRFNDLFVIWIWEKIKERFFCRGVVTLKDKPFAEMERAIAGLLEYRSIKRVAVDATGMGSDIAERMIARYGEDRVDRVVFTNAVKGEIAARLRAAVVKEEVSIPASHEIVHDWNSIEQEVTKGGLIRYVAAHTASGHADMFWGAGLGLYAAPREIKSDKLVMVFGK